jgi:peptidoglycan hydrolase CwlO-like protein
MAEPMSTLSPEKLNSVSNPVSSTNDDFDITWDDPPSSPFVSHLDHDDQENVAPSIAPTPLKPLIDLENEAPQSAFKVSPEKKSGVGLKERTSPAIKSPSRQLFDDFEEEAITPSTMVRASPKKSSPVKHLATERPESAMSSRSRRSSPSKSSRNASADSTKRLPTSLQDKAPDWLATPSKRPSSSHKESALRDNEGLTVAMKFMEERHSESHESSTTYQTHNGMPELEETGIEDTDFNPDGPQFSSLDVDDTCFSAFSEMPGMDMTKFAGLRNSPTRNGLFDQVGHGYHLYATSLTHSQATPRAHAQMTPSTIRRTERTPSPTPRRSRNENDTTNLLLDFTAQFEAFSTSRRGSPLRGRGSPPRSTTEPNLLSYYQNQRSPAKGGASQVPSTPGHNRQLLNLLDFELPPPPTPRSVPTVTIRELESLKSNFQSQISSLTASLSGKEAQVESLVQAVSDAERRVGEAQEVLREEKSSREYAESQMTDWKKKGEEVQNLLQEVQSEMARNDTERESLLARLAEAEKRAEESDARSSDLETRLIEAESKNVDMTTMINPEEEGKKMYSELECQTAVAEKVNEVARELHSAYKAKHEKKIKALKDNYQKKADERCKELRVQIIRLERQAEEAEKKRDDTFSKVLPTDLNKDTTKCPKCSTTTPTAAPSSNPNDLKLLEAHKSEIENLKAKIVGLQSELESLRSSHDSLLQDLETERVEKGELVAAAEQMLVMCNAQMEELQQEELRKSQARPSSSGPPKPSSSVPQQQPEHTMRNTGFLAGTSSSNVPPSSTNRPGSALGGGRPGSALGERGSSTVSGIGKPSGLRAPGGFGYGGGGAPGLSRSTSGGKSRLLSNIERMGGGRAQQQGQQE